jgi:hypothetical protein
MKDENVDAVARALFRAWDDAVCLGREPSHDFDVMAEGAEYDDPRPVIEGWHAAAQAAISLGARPRRADPKERLAELLGPDSTNFLGTGLSLREFLELHNAEKIAQSWPLQPREEQRRRLTAVVRLSAELERVREKENFATRLAEMAIEAVIEGDWKMVEEWVEHFSFEDERDEIRIPSSATFATFRELLLQALRVGREGPA